MFVTSVGNLEHDLKNYELFNLPNNIIERIDEEVFFSNVAQNNYPQSIFTKHEYAATFEKKEDNFYKITEQEFGISNNKIDIRNDFDKIFISSSYAGFGHFILDTIGLILQCIKYVKNPFIVININNFINLPWSSEDNDDPIKYILFLKKFLETYDIPYIFLKNNYSVAINNFYHVSWIEHSDFLYNEVYKMAQHFIKNNNKNNEKKVYIRSKSNINNLKHSQFQKTHLIGHRIINENYLEDFLKEFEFEVIDPQSMFDSVEEQMQYFDGVKTIMSTTSSGLINALFMRPGSNVIELMSPMNDQFTKNYYRLHSYLYQDICYAKSHNYFGQKNLIDGKLIVKGIKNNEKFLDMLR